MFFSKVNLRMIKLNVWQRPLKKTYEGVQFQYSYTTNIALNIQSSFKYFDKTFNVFFSNSNINSFFISTTDNTEVSNIISSPNPLKPIRPNSIPSKTLKLPNKYFSNQLTLLFDLPFSTGVYPSIF